MRFSREIKKYSANVNSPKKGSFQKHSGDITIMEQTVIFMKKWLVEYTFTILIHVIILTIIFC